jgi:uncharacterized protein with HEPN domain
MKTKDKTIIMKIKKESDLIVKITEDCSMDEFAKNIFIHRTIAMTLLNIGELSTHLSTEVKNQNKHIPWKKLSDFRNAAAHRYDSLKNEDIWIYAKTEIPPILEKLEQLVRCNLNSTT